MALQASGRVVVCTNEREQTMNTEYMDDDEIAAAIIEQSRNAFELIKLLDADRQAEVIELLQQTLAELES